MYKKIFHLSLVLLLAFIFGCKEPENTNIDDDKKTEPAVNQYTVLKITGIPEDKFVLAGALLDLSDVDAANFLLEEQVLVAAGINNGGEIYLYDPGFSKPWKGSGDFSVGLIEVTPDFSLDQLTMIENLLAGEVVEENYIYAGFDTTDFLNVLSSIDFTLIDPANPLTLTALLPLADFAPMLNNFNAGLPVYTFDEDDTVEFAWNSFIPVSAVEPLLEFAPLLEVLSSSEGSAVATIENVPENEKILGIVLLDGSITIMNLLPILINQSFDSLIPFIIAFGVDFSSSGEYVFYDIDPITPWDEEGNYKVALYGIEQIYIYGTQGFILPSLNTYTYSDTEPMIFDINDFKIQYPIPQIHE